MQLSDLRLPPIDSADRFEQFCVDVFRIKYKDPYIQRNGARGQRQDGVDVFCHVGPKLEWVGIQCKVRSRGKGLRTKEIQQEIELAKTFNPKLAHYVIATTCDRDFELQESVRVHNSSRPEFTVEIIFWDDLQDTLSYADYQSVLYRYYKGFFVDASKHGYVHGRLMTIRMGKHDEYDTKHEIILGKIPIIDRERSGDIDYFQDRYFLCDLNARTFDIFTKDTYPSDFENAIKFKLDREMLSQWINSVDLEEVLYEEETTYGYLMSDSDFKAFLDRNRSTE